MKDLNRRTFLVASGAVATGAAVAAAPKLAGAVAQRGSDAAKEPPAAVIEPSGPAPREPVMAYVRDAQSGHVTVMSGTHETTYRDPALVKRLLGAAPNEGELATGGDANVVAP